MTFPIVAIASSAGGLEALTELLAALPAQSGLAYIAVQHLDPDHESLLAEILKKKTPLVVMPAREGLAIEPDHVYVIPPNSTLSVRDGHLHVIPRASGRHHPADVLFTSVAEERGDCTIGIVLSGGDGDGAVGIQAIKEAGGITFAQEPSSAKFPSMPQHAIDTGCVDFVLRPNQIARELVRLGQHPYLRAIPAPIGAASGQGLAPVWILASVSEEERAPHESVLYPFSIALARIRFWRDVRRSVENATLPFWATCKCDHDHRQPVGASPRE